MFVCIGDSVTRGTSYLVTVAGPAEAGANTGSNHKLSNKEKQAARHKVPIISHEQFTRFLESGELDDIPVHPI